jgi:hypothetical protein
LSILLKEFQKFLCTMARQASADDLAGRNVECNEQWRSPIALIVVRHGAGTAFPCSLASLAPLPAVLADGLPTVDAACAEAIARNVHSPDIVLNILARQRNPGPPATLFTPAALTLRHSSSPICARYDNLRRTIQ